MDRREFLKDTSLWAAYAMMAKLILRDAYANTLTPPASAENYVALALPFAPSRWQFDHLLKTRSNQTLSPSPMVVTRFTGSGAVASAPDYVTFDHQGVQVPYLWSTQVPNASGSSRALSDLLNHLIVFRGYGTGIDGHPFNSLRQFAPSPSLGSISGYMADRYNPLLRSVLYPAHRAEFIGYRSLQGTGQAAIHLHPETANVLETLLRPFLQRSALANISTLRSRHKDLVENVGRVLAAAMEKDRPGLRSVQIDKEAAAAQLAKGFEDLQVAWTGLFNRYLSVCNAAYRDRGVVGVSDRPVVAVDDGVAVETIYQMDITTPQGTFAAFPVNGTDLRDMAATAKCTQMAQTLALTEFILTRRLSNSLEMGVGEPEMTGQFSRKQGQAPSAFTSSFVFRYDEHFSGQVPTLYFGSCHHRALGAGLNVLVDTLKAASLFDKTALHLASDFGRAPRNTGTGSDHGFDCMVASVITGKRTGGPLVVGNILRDGSGGVLAPFYAGTFGYKAPTNLNGQNVILTPANVASSIGVLLGFTDIPWATTGAPMIALANGNVVAKASGEIV